MAMLVKTIWQSQELKVKERPASDSQLILFEKNLLSDNVEQIKGPQMLSKRKKAVSFHGVEMPKLDDSMQWRLHLKRSSASTNVSLLNLSESGKDGRKENRSLTETDGTSEISEATTSPIEESEKDCTANISTLDLTETTILTKAKDSICDLRLKNAKINQHVQNLKCQVDYTALCENLELRHQEAEELENYCNQLEEKLSCLHQTVQGVWGKQEKQSKEIEDCVGFGITDDSADAQCDQEELKEENKTEDSQTTDLSDTIAKLLSSVNVLQQTMERDAHKTGRSKVVAAMETQDMTICAAALDEIRNNLFQLNTKYERENNVLNNVHRMVFHMSTRFDSFLSQWERVQKQQTQMKENIQELQANADGIYSLVKKISLRCGQICSELDTFWQVKPLLEDVSRNLSLLKIQEFTEMFRARNNCPNINNIRYVIDQAMTSLLEEIKSHIQQNGCSDCQRLQKKIMDLEGQIVEKHMRAVVISSDLRLLQEDSLRLESMLLKDQINTESKQPLDSIKLKICSLQDQLKKLCSQFETDTESSSSLSQEQYTNEDSNDQSSNNLTNE